VKCSSCTHTSHPSVAPPPLYAHKIRKGDWQRLRTHRHTCGHHPGAPRLRLQSGGDPHPVGCSLREATATVPTSACAVRHWTCPRLCPRCSRTPRQRRELLRVRGRDVLNPLGLRASCRAARGRGCCCVAAHSATGSPKSTLATAEARIPSTPTAGLLRPSGEPPHLFRSAPSEAGLYDISTLGATDPASARVGVEHMSCGRPFCTGGRRNVQGWCMQCIAKVYEPHMRCTTLSHPARTA